MYKLCVDNFLFNRYTIEVQNFSNNLFWDNLKNYLKSK